MWVEDCLKEEVGLCALDWLGVFEHRPHWQKVR